MQIDVRGGWITVVAPLPQTPAERAGIEAGDQIEEVNGKSTQGISQDGAVKTLRGEIGTKAVLKVHRPGIPQLMTFSLVRETIHSRSTQPGTILENNVGYVSLTTISDSSAGELQREIDGLLKQGMKGLILDLRGNPGGLLTQGVRVSDLFLDAGRKIVETRGRMADMTHLYTDTDAAGVARRCRSWCWSTNSRRARPRSLPAHCRTTTALRVVGTATFGKGLVQTFWSFGDGKGLKLTTGRWYTPSGRTIQRAVKSGEEQIDLASAEANYKNLHWLDSLPSFKTISGRAVKGGGGIVPDRLVQADTLTAADRTFAKAIGSNVSVFRDALVAEALDLKEKHAITSQSFVVTDAMRQAVLARMKAKNVTLTTEQAAGGAHLLDEQLSYEVERLRVRSCGRAAPANRRRFAGSRCARLSSATAARRPALMAQVAGGPSGQ